jgi:hypothetical protein
MPFSRRLPQVWTRWQNSLSTRISLVCIAAWKEYHRTYSRPQRSLDLKKSYEVQSKEEVTTSRDEAQKIDARLGSLAQVGANPQVPWEMTLAENTPRTILLPRFDPTSGREAFKAVVINVHDIQSDGKKKTVRIDQVSADSSDPKPTEIVAVPQPYHEGQGLPLDSKRWRLTVVLIEKHWYGKSSVTLRLVPDESDSANRGSDVAQMK